MRGVGASRADQVGANRETQLTIFSTESDVLAKNDLGTAILSSILSDCERTVDAINLAVRAARSHATRTHPPIVPRRPPSRVLATAVRDLARPRATSRDLARPHVTSRDLA